ncbi:hypothetical protein BDY17DRAFT_38768 [Neohortaea acidophila]|uniref:Uncharacterized protein n=1 Tax=Neohortaea acidophila TaxID=245834 RepID=A0A6A6PIA5_9PEZI|nr:uncharacterized protein BDY17DRAFT_38768 [Neohortaea acidophila]KAF2479451.1 hypothetical protein BDY17DRAFT_38768 [Neohortaea acidophila]
MEAMSTSPNISSLPPENPNLVPHSTSDAAPSRPPATRTHMQPADAPHLSPAVLQGSSTDAQSTQESDALSYRDTSSDASQLTGYTDSTSTTSVAATATEPTRDDSPARSSESATASNQADTITSPPLVVTNGTKRTASGHIKNTPSLPHTPLTSSSAFSNGRARTDSMSSTSSRAGDLAIALKTRLGYAMAKVQQGWEHKNINEVEDLTRRKTHANRHSMSHLDYARRPMTDAYPNGHLHRFSSYEPNGYHHSSALPLSKRHSANYSYSSLHSASQPLPSTDSGPRLQPAADIRPAGSNTQPHPYNLQPPFSSSQPNITTTSSNMLSPPRTPVNGSHHHHHHHRPPTIRTELQTAEAEREALQALFQLGSPQGATFHHNHHRYQSASVAGSSQNSPLRSEFATPRKVMFARSDSDESGLSRSGSSEQESAIADGVREGEMVEV